MKILVRVFDKIRVHKGGLDLSKEVLRVSVDQREAELRAAKFVVKKNPAPQK